MTELRDSDLHRPDPALPRPAPVTVVTWTDAAAWDAFVRRAGDGTQAHRWAWLDIVAATYHHRTFPLAAVRDGRLAGVLPLVLVRSRLFGRHLVSVPYLDCGGVCTAGDADAERALVDAALGLAAVEGAQLELRQRSARAIPLPVSTHKVTMTLDLTGGEDAVWRHIKSNRRGQVRKAQRNGLVSEVAGVGAVPELFRILATNMRDLGSPMHRRAFFRHTCERLGDEAAVVLVRRDGEAIGAGLLLEYADGMTLPFSSSLRATFPLGTNQLLYWAAVRHAIARGSRVFDFGRSSPESGTFEAKREWGSEPLQLWWYQHPRPADGDGAQRLDWATRAWRQLPVPLATAGGHLIRGGLPQ